jgi:hypothetical protein
LAIVAPAVNQWLKEGTRGGGERRHLRIRNALVVTEIAFAMLLLIGAGLLINSFARLRSVDPGYDAHGVLSMWVTAPAERYRDPESKARFYQQMLDETARVPGVQGVTLTSSVPLGSIGFPFNIEEHPLAGGDANTRYSAIAANYFRVLKAKMRAGREFDAHDDLKAPAVMIIATKQWPASISPAPINRAKDFAQLSCAQGGARDCRCRRRSQAGRVGSTDETRSLRAVHSTALVLAGICSSTPAKPRLATLRMCSRRSGCRSQPDCFGRENLDQELEGDDRRAAAVYDPAGNVCGVGAGAQPWVFIA